VTDWQRRALALLERDDLYPAQEAWLIGMSERTTTPKRAHFRYLSALEFRLASTHPPRDTGSGWS
jgi:arginine deiminase